MRRRIEEDVGSEAGGSGRGDAKTTLAFHLSLLSWSFVEFFGWLDCVSSMIRWQDHRLGVPTLQDKMRMTIIGNGA